MAAESHTTNPSSLTLARQQLESCVGNARVFLAAIDDLDSGNPDQALGRLAGLIPGIEARLEALRKSGGSGPAHDAAWGVVADDRDALVEAIAKIPAGSMPGWAAKAQALAWYDECLGLDDEDALALTRSLVNDLKASQLA